MLVSDIQPTLERFVGPSGTVSDAEFLTALNQVRERYINSGKWKGMVVEIDVTPVDSVITLPSNCESVLGAQLDGRPVVVFSRQHEFVPGGPGEVTAGTGGAVALIDQGDRTYKIMGASDVTTAHLTCKLRYVDLEEGELATGNIVVAGASTPAVNGTYTLAGTMYGKPFYVLDTSSLFTVFWSSSAWCVQSNPTSASGAFVYYTSSDDVATPDLATTWTEGFGTLTAETTAAVTDDVIPGNLGALKLGLQALAYEDQNDLDRSEVYWTKGLTLLNDQTRQARGAAQTTLQQSPHAFHPGRLRTLF